MRAKKIGLYLGINSVSAVAIQRKNIVSLANFKFSSLEKAEDGALSKDIRWEALINKTLREAGADNDNVYISLADKDFIFRPLEMPLMRGAEIESALIYEIEKYIPFKVEELEWDYKYVRFLKEKKINLSFVGIKENNLKRIRDLLSRLKINVIAIEPSCLSLVRVVKSLARFSKIKNFALLDFAEDEAYLTFFQNDLPIFNRYLAIPKKEESFDLDKFIESVNFSFQYFKREFKTYKLDKFIVVGDNSNNGLVSSLEELQVVIETVSIRDLTACKNAKVGNIKALGAAGKELYPCRFKPVLKSTKVRAEGKEAFKDIPILKTGLLCFLLCLGLGGLFFFSTFTRNKLAEKKDELERRKEELVIPEEFNNLSWEKKEEFIQAKKEDNEFLRNTTVLFVNIFPFFERLGSKDTIPFKLWIDELSISWASGRYEAGVRGYIFRGDDYEERLGVNEFVSILREDEVINSIFPSVELEFSEQSKIEEFSVTHFSVKLQQ